MQSLLAESPRESVFHFSEARCDSHTTRGGKSNLVTVCTETQRTADENSGDNAK